MARPRKEKTVNEITNTAPKPAIKGIELPEEETVLSPAPPAPVKEPDEELDTEGFAVGMGGADDWTKIPTKDGWRITQVSNTADGRATARSITYKGKPIIELARPGSGIILDETLFKKTPEGFLGSQSGHSIAGLLTQKDWERYAQWIAKDQSRRQESLQPGEKITRQTLNHRHTRIAM